MAALIVIPARYASTRYPGKPLVGLRGAGGEARSLIRRTWDAAMQVGGDTRVVVATDDERIWQEAEGFGAEVGLDLEPFGEAPDPEEARLRSIYDDEIEAAARAAYQRDYVGFGFGDWDGQAA